MNKPDFDEEIEKMEANYKRLKRELIIAVSYLVGMWLIFVLVVVLLILGI